MDDYTKALSEHVGLSKRIDFSRRYLQRAREAIAAQSMCSRKDICIYAAGSLGRLETGQISDLDVFLFAHNPERQSGQRTLTRLEEIQVLSEIIQVNAALKMPPFSGDGEYFKIHEVSNLIAGTGTSIDDSENLFTTRLLLLLESKCLVNDRLYQFATKEVIDMYIRDRADRDDYMPLFLLNDMLRYWRTVCLNYERTRHDRSKPWWKKNLNLKFSRKLTVFSTVLAIMVEHVDAYDKFVRFFAMTPMERLAHSLDTLEEPAFLAEFQVFLDNYEEFLAAKSHAELEHIRPDAAAYFKSTAQQFDDFLHRVFASERLDRRLVRYLMI